MKTNRQMKKIRLSILIPSVFVILGLSTCAELDEEPIDFVGPDNFFTTPAQVESAFIGSMSRLYEPWSRYGYGIWTGAFRGTDQIRGGDLALSANWANFLWQGHYQAIGDLNAAIRALNEDKLGSGVSQEEKDLLMAQGRFLRAFNYFALVRLYGDVPLILEDTDVAGEDISRTPTLTVYEQVISDFQFAITNLPDTWPGQPGRPSKGAAKGFLAKVYLTMATAPVNDASYYAQARDLAADLMDDGIYNLAQNVEDVFKLEDRYGPEMIWGFNATEDDPSTCPQIWLPFTMANGWSDIRTERDWATAYPDQPRKDAYLLLVDWDGTSWEDWNGPNVKKFLYDSRANHERFLNTQGVPLIRYSDVVLMFAEADNMASGGPTQAAVDAVNGIIDRANGYVANPNHPNVSAAMSVEEFDAAVINERNYELCFELDRWYDLIRKRILCDVQIESIKVNCDDNDYLFPIPQADLRLNSNLTQNPGYAVPGD